MIQLYGKNVEPLEPGTYLACSLMSPDSEFHTEHVYYFRLEGNLHITYEHLRDTESMDLIGYMTKDGWSIVFDGGDGVKCERVFSDITVFTIGT